MINTNTDRVAVLLEKTVNGDQFRILEIFRTVTIKRGIQKLFYEVQVQRLESNGWTTISEKYKFSRICSPTSKISSRTLFPLSATIVLEGRCQAFFVLEAITLENKPLIFS